MAHRGARFVLVLRTTGWGTTMRGRRTIDLVGNRRMRIGRAGGVALLILLTLVVPLLPFRGAAVGAPLYPDLRTSPPAGLYFERGSDGRYRLRFDNTVGNYGGRLEIAVDGDRDIYQNVYDRITGGNRAVRTKVSSDLIFHPEHNHFHFANFARYELLERDDAGLYRVARRGSKTTFCILDYVRLTSSGPSAPQYSTPPAAPGSRVSPPAGGTPTTPRLPTRRSNSADRSWRTATTPSVPRPIPAASCWRPTTRTMSARPTSRFGTASLR
jgi:hypothetical protein